MAIALSWVVLAVGVATATGRAAVIPLVPAVRRRRQPVDDDFAGRRRVVNLARRSPPMGEPTIAQPSCHGNAVAAESEGGGERYAYL